MLHSEDLTVTQRRHAVHSAATKSWGQGSCRGSAPIKTGVAGRPCAARGGNNSQLQLQCRIYSSWLQRGTGPSHSPQNIIVCMHSAGSFYRFGINPKAHPTPSTHTMPRGLPAASVLLVQPWSPDSPHAMAFGFVTAGKDYVTP